MVSDIRFCAHRTGLESVVQFLFDDICCSQRKAEDMVMKGNQVIIQAMCISETFVA